MNTVLEHKELVIMKEAGKIAGTILKKLKKVIQPGITTKDIELFFDKFIEKYPDVTAAFKGYHGYPASLCTSVNEEVIHGIPSENRILKSGDLVGVDLGLIYQGLYVDTAFTYGVGKISKEAKQLLKVGERSLKEGIKQAKAGNTIGDIGNAVQQYVESQNMSVVRRFVGHGIGRQLHWPPEVPNYGIKGSGQKLVEGMVLAIEPMIGLGTYKVDILDDGWTAVTKDRKLSSHFEHTVAITKKGPWVLTS